MSFRNIILLLCSATLLLNCSHTYTGQIWNKQSITRDRIDSFVITKDKHKIIFVSEKFHYIFDANQALSEILSWSDNKFLRVYLSKSFNLDNKNMVSGSFVLGATEKEVTPSQLAKMKTLGFTQKANTNEYILRINLSGERFLSNGVNFNNLGQLNDKYWVSINTDKTTGDYLLLAAITPFTVATDVFVASIVVVAMVYIAPQHIGEKNGKELGKKLAE